MIDLTNRYDKLLIAGQIRGYAEKHDLSVRVKPRVNLTEYILSKKSVASLGEEEDMDILVQLPDNIDEKRIPVIHVYDGDLGGLELPKRIALGYNGEIAYVVKYTRDPILTVIDTNKLKISLEDFR